MSEQAISATFDLLAQLALALGAAPIKGKVWTHRIDESWDVKINGCSEQKDGILPYHAELSFNGWPAGVMSPFGGWIAAGSLANERALIAAIEAALERAKTDPADCGEYGKETAK